jgi:glycosyltransferase involved in cell wall biosynthesis
MIHIAVQQFKRSSGGGLVVNDEFTQALNSIPKCEYSTFVEPNELNPHCDVVICMGTRAIKLASKPVIMWPLTVAPLDRDAIRVGSTSIRTAIKYRLLRFKVGRSLGRASGLVFGSAYSRDLHRQHFPNIRTIPTLTMRPGIVPSAAICHGERKPVVPGHIVMVSHLYPYKLIVEAVEAFHRVAKQLPHVTMTIVGRATDTFYERKIVKAIRGDTRIRILGFVPARELSGIYTSADVVLFNSLCENAGSLTTFEALWFGRAMVCSDRSSMPESMGSAVRYANPYNPQEVADAILELLNNESLKKDYEHKALERAREFQTWSERAREVVNFCRELVTSKQESK